MAEVPGARSNLLIKKSGIKKNKIKYEIYFNLILGKINFCKKLFLNEILLTHKKVKAHHTNNKFLGNSLNKLETL
tara:strand:+ start:354 stop:578 length:225 start_codon:yes stop_codon:yes gene_type:complete